MNTGTCLIVLILGYEERMKALGLLPLVEHTTIWWKLSAITLERMLRTEEL